MKSWSWWEDPKPGTVVIRYYKGGVVNKVVRIVFILVALGLSAYVAYRAVRFLVEAIIGLFR